MMSDKELEAVLDRNRQRLMNEANSMPRETWRKWLEETNEQLTACQRENEMLLEHTWCAYCHKRFDLTADDALDYVEAHIFDCPKHPIRALVEHIGMREPAVETLKALTREKRKLERENERLRGALAHISGDCKNVFGGNCFEAGRVIGAEYGADAVCESCIANAALEAEEGQDDD